MPYRYLLIVKKFRNDSLFFKLLKKIRAAGKPPNIFWRESAVDRSGRLTPCFCV